METKWCPKCEADIPIVDFIRNKARGDGLSGYCHACMSVISREKDRQVRIKIVVALGGKCTRCDWTDPRALQVDHVNGGGATERRTTKGSPALLRDVLAHPDKYQLLCANHNAIKRIEEAEHKGDRVYNRVAPTERIKTGGKHSPEATAKRVASVKAHLDAHPEVTERRMAKTKQYWAEHPEEWAARAEKIAAGKRGLKKGPDGKMYRPEPEPAPDAALMAELDALLRGVTTHRLGRIVPSGNLGAPQRNRGPLCPATPLPEPPSTPSPA